MNVDDPLSAICAGNREGTSFNIIQASTLVEYASTKLVHPDPAEWLLSILAYIR